MCNLVINGVHYLIHKQPSLVSQITDRDPFIVLIKISVETPMNLLPLLSNKHHIGNQKLGLQCPASKGGLRAHSGMTTGILSLYAKAKIDHPVGIKSMTAKRSDVYYISHVGHPCCH